MSICKIVILQDANGKYQICYKYNNIPNCYRHIVYEEWHMLKSMYDKI